MTKPDQKEKGGGGKRVTSLVIEEQAFRDFRLLCASRGVSVSSAIRDLILLELDKAKEEVRRLKED